MVIRKLTLGQWSTNCYLVACPRTGDAALIDAPADPEAIQSEAKGLKVRFILMTHSHRDHIQALPAIKVALGAPVAAHPSDAADLGVPVDVALAHGQQLTVGDVVLEVLHTPGHTPGSLCYRYGKHLFSGDTLFPGGPGRTRTPADLDIILGSIKGRLLPLPDSTAICPGHGPDAVLGRERGAIMAFLGRPRRADLCGDVLWAA